MTWQIRTGDMLEVLSTLAPNSIDSCITDPPYGIKLMGKKWDRGVPGVPYWEAVFRVLKPGAMLLAFGGTRTHHRLMCAIEDAGFELRDCLMWVYAQGFPKGINISKAIDKAAGVEREVVGVKLGHEEFVGRSTNGDGTFKHGAAGFDRPWMHDADARAMYHMNTAPATDEAKLWDGWGSALKPSYEPIILAMKPLDGTFAQNALKHGVAGLNIDGCRIGRGEGGERTGEASATRRYTEKGSSNFSATPGPRGGDAAGRWPANLVFSHHPDCEIVGSTTVKGRVISRFDDGMKPFGDGAGHAFTSSSMPDEEIPVYRCVEGCPVKALDEQSGELKSGTLLKQHHVKESSGWTGGSRPDRVKTNFPSSSGGASRFFYCAKPSVREKTHGGTVNNDHPTTKPLELMRWLCRLVSTPTGGIVLDPFCGSGTTGVAAVLEGRNFIGIEQSPGYAEIARGRLRAAWHTKP